MSQISQQELRKRLDNLERLVREMHAKIMTGQSAELKPGCEEIKRAAREMIDGNFTLVDALGGRKMSTTRQGGSA